MQPFSCLPLLLIAGFSAPTLAQLSAFSYQPERAPPVGTVWHYTKSNRDGSDPWHLDVYFAAPNRIEVVKWVEGASDFVEVIADLDPARAMPVVMSQWNTAEGRRQPRLSARAEGGQALSVHLPDGNQAKIEAQLAPLHVWGFDLMGLAFMLPHLVDPAQAFEVSFVDPNRPGQGAPFAVDRARFEPQGFEDIDGVRSRKYQLGGPIFGEHQGTVWLNAESGRLERAEHVIPTSTDWKDFKLDLVGSEQLGGLAWEAFKQGLADAQLANSGGGGRKLAGALKSAYDRGGLEAAEKAETEFLADLVKSHEKERNTFAYALLGLGKTEDALKVFTRITRDYPESANAWDSLGEAQAEAGDIKTAIASYRKVLELDPGNAHALQQIEALEKRR